MLPSEYDALADIKAHAEQVRAVLLHGTAEKKQKFISDLAVLNVCGECERTFFKALLYRVSMPKAFTLAALQQPLYERATYAVPFQYAAPKSFFGSMYVAKTRLLADATGDQRITLYQAARDKMWKEYTPNEAAPPALLFQAAGIPYWCFTIQRTQIGEGKPAGYFPEAPKPVRSTVIIDDVADEINIAAPRHAIATKPCRRAKPIVINEEDLEND